jgi:hypothetical protein
MGRSVLSLRDRARGSCLLQYGTSGACSTLLTTLSKRDTSNRSECEFLTDE